MHPLSYHFKLLCLLLFAFFALPGLWSGQIIHRRVQDFHGTASRAFREIGQPPPLQTWPSDSNLNRDCQNWSRAKEYCGTSTSDCLIHVIHVPKTGGSSVRQMLHDWIRQSKEFHLSMYESNMQEMCSDGAATPRNGQGVLVGHHGFGLNSDRTVRLFSVILMRNPIARFLSYLNYIKQEERAPLDWHEKSMDDLIAEYHMFQSSNASLEPTAPFNKYNPIAQVFWKRRSLSTGNHFIHHALTEQLASVAGYQCALTSPDTNFNNCQSPDYSENGACSLHNMKVLAFENLQRADAVILDTDLSMFISMAKFHWAFTPKHVRHELVNAARNTYDKADMINATSLGYLKSWLADELEVYEFAKQQSRRQNEFFTACVQSIQG